MKEISVKFHLSDSEYLTALRLVAGAVCSAADVDVDAMEDFKVCVTESALILKNCGSESAEVTFACDKGVSASVRGIGGEPKEGENELSLALISALVSEFSAKKDGYVITGMYIKL